MDSPSTSTTFETVFRAGMYWRIFYGFARVLLAGALFGVLGQTSSEVITTLFGHELVEDPHDILVTTLLPILTHFSFTITAFLTLYFLFWGSIDAFLSIQMLRHKLWAFPVSIVLMSVFTAYEVFRFFHTHSGILLWVIVVDITIIFLVRGEYRRLTTHRAF